MRTGLLLLVAICGLSLSSCATGPKVAPAAQASPPGLSAEAHLEGSALLADLDLLRAEFTALHPGLYRYNSPAEVDARLVGLAQQLHGGSTLREAFRALALFAASLRCGHTYLNPYNQSEAVQRALFAGPRLPLRFRWLQGRMIVLESLAAGAPIAAGSEILSIDGQPASELLAQLLPLARADGGNDAKRIANLERRGLDRFEPFDVGYALVHPKADPAFTLELREQGGTPRTLRLPALLGLPAEPKESRKSGALWDLRFLDANTGYLSMQTWETWVTKWDWKAELGRELAELESHGATRLVVDLRGNEGGSDVGDALLAHFIDAPLPQESLQRWVRFRSVPSALRAPLHTWDPSFFELGAGPAAEPLENGFFRLTRFDDDARGDVLSPAAPRVHARLIVLVDGANSSATFQFAQLVQRHHLGKLVGEPTGGNQRGINGGAFFFLSLPGSGLEIDLPLIARFPPDGHPEHLPDTGLQPDLLVVPTAEDLAAARDPILAAALALP